MPTNSRIVANEEALNSRSRKATRSSHRKGQPIAPEDGTANTSKHAERKATVVTEENHSERPSRKSTRASSHRGKNSGVLEHVASVKSTTSSARHAKR
ncbi:MAG: hypothetical protein ACO1OB_07065 [Archangium sp.]